MAGDEGNQRRDENYEIIAIARLQFSLELLKRNYRELAVFIEYFTAPAVALSYSPVEQKWLQQEGMTEATYLLHNYVASAVSLVEHTRVLHRRLYEPSGKIPEYTLEVGNRFTTDPLTQFVLKLRQMAQHYRLPSLHLQYQMSGPSNNADVKITLSLTKRDLLQFSGWTAPARRYLDASSDQIDLLKMAQAYQEHVLDFYEWFAEKQREVHGIGPERYQRMLMHGRYPAQRVEIEQLAANIAELEAKNREELTFQDLESAFAPVLSVLDQLRLMLCRHSASAVVRRALEAAESRFSVPSELKDRVNALVEPFD